MGVDEQIDMATRRSAEEATQRLRRRPLGLPPPRDALVTMWQSQQLVKLALAELLRGRDPPT